MTIVLTPEPAVDPTVDKPRVRIDLDAGVGNEFVSLTVFRDGSPIRSQPPTNGLRETYVWDYEAPFGVASSYTAVGESSSGWASVFAEEWASLSGWLTSTGTPAVSGGQLVSGSVQRSDVAFPSTGRLVLDEVPTGDGYVIFGPLTAYRSGPTVMLGTEHNSQSIAAASGPVVVQWSGGTATMTHDGSTVTSMLGGSLALVPLMASAACPGFDISIPDPLATESYSAAAATTLTETSAWLIHPSQPSLSVCIDAGAGHWREDAVNVALDSAQNTSYQSSRIVKRPTGRRRAVVYPQGVRQDGEWPLVLMVHSLAARDSVLTLLSDQALLLLRSPASWPWGLPDGFYSVGDVSGSRIVRPLQHPDRYIELPLLPVEEPPVEMAPSVTWGSALLAGSTWPSPPITATWLDLLMGEA